MLHLNKTAKIAILVTLALGLAGALWFQSLRIHRLYKEVDRPTMERRQLSAPRLHSWMTVEEISQKCHVPEGRVFEALGIKAQAGDEKLPLKKLEEKYNKSRDDIRQGLDSLQGGKPATPSGQES